MMLPGVQGPSRLPSSRRRVAGTGRYRQCSQHRKDPDPGKRLPHRSRRDRPESSFGPRRVDDGTRPVPRGCSTMAVLMRTWTVPSLQGGTAALAARMASSTGPRPRELRKTRDSKMSLSETASEVCGIFVPNSDSLETDARREMQAPLYNRYGSPGQ